MLNLTIRTTRRVTSGDLRLAIDPPLFFEVKCYVSFDLNLRLAQWQEAGRDNAAEAAALVSELFVSVGQAGQVYPLDSREAVEALRETVEAQGPGEGDAFIVALLHGFTINHFNFFSREASALETWQPASENGSSPVALPSER